MKCPDCGSWTTCRAWCPTTRERAARREARTERLTALVATLPVVRCGSCGRDVRVSGDHQSWCVEALAQPTREELQRAEWAKWPPVKITIGMTGAEETCEKFAEILRALGSERCTVVPIEWDWNVAPMPPVVSVPIGTVTATHPDGTISVKMEASLCTSRVSTANLSSMYGITPRDDETPLEFRDRCAAMRGPMDNRDGIA